MKRNLTILINFFSLFLSNISFSQDIGQTFQFAERLYRSGDYSSALTTYERVLFFDDGFYRKSAFHQIGNCFFELKDFEKAAQYYDHAYFSEINDSIKIELIFKKTQALLLLKKFNDGIAELLNIADDSTSYFGERRNFYLGIAYFGLNEIVESEKYFLYCVKNAHKSVVNEIKSEFESLRKVNNRKPHIAKILSIILPGAGQFYCGDIKNGVNSMVLNAAVIGLGFLIAKSYTPIDAAIAVFPWIHRYYTGGIKKSESIAIQKINEKRTVIYQNILELISTSRK